LKCPPGWGRLSFPPRHHPQMPLAVAPSSPGYKKKEGSNEKQLDEILKVVEYIAT